MTTFAEAAELIRLKTGRKPNSMAEVRQILASTPGKGVGSGIALANQGGLTKGYFHGGYHSSYALAEGEKEGKYEGTDPEKQGGVVVRDLITGKPSMIFPEKGSGSSSSNYFSDDGVSSKKAKGAAHEGEYRNVVSPEKMKEITDAGIDPKDLGLSTAKSGMGYTTWQGNRPNSNILKDKINNAIEEAKEQEVAEVTDDEVEEVEGGEVLTDDDIADTLIEEAQGGGEETPSGGGAVPPPVTPFDPNVNPVTIPVASGENQKPVEEFTYKAHKYTPTTTAFTPAAPVQPMTGTVGTTEAATPTYYNPLVNQAADFASRAEAQQQFYQPQTLAEQQATGVGDFSGKIENRPYRNMQGMVQYITFIDGRPQTPIPPGYMAVQPAAANRGVYVRGYTNGGLPEDDPTYVVNVPAYQNPATITQDQLAAAQDSMSAQAFYNPAGSIAAQNVAYQDPNQAGTVMASTTGQALPTAPIVDANQIAQVGQTTQATMPTLVGAALAPVTTPFTQAPQQSDFKSNEDYLKFLNTPFEGIDLSSVAEGSKQYATPQLSMTGPLPKGYYSGPLDGIYRYGEGPYAEQTQKFLDSIGQTADQFIGKTKEQEEQERLQSLNLLTGSTKPTATGTQEQIKDMTFDPATTEYTSQPVLDENNQPIMDPVLDAQGQPVMEQATNPDGTPQVDADGNPVMQPKTKMRMQTALSDAATITGQQATETMVSGVDAAQNLEPVLDAQGNPVMEQVFDAQGNPVLDPETGQPVTRAKMKTKATTVEGAPTRILQTGDTADSLQLKSAKMRVENLLQEENLEQEYQNQIAQYDRMIQVSFFAREEDIPPRPTKEGIKAQLEASLKQINDTLASMPEAGPSELVSGSAVDQAQVDTTFGTGELQAASVQDEMSTLMKQFEGGDTPAWAAGAMRKATALMSARNLGASSMAGQAIIQAAMEAALPIAQIDASNKQEMALFKAEQRAKFMQLEFDQNFQAKVINASRVSEVANMNFTADQQIALENSKMAQTVDLANLTNRQAVVMSEAAALSQLDIANLTNLQQAAVQNAQNFLQVEMTNLSNSQQMAMFKQQTLANSILTDAAAENAMAQFNATSEQQRDQFMIGQANQISQFNAAQSNAIKQFNANEANAIAKFNAQLQDQREMFNAKQYSVIAQANAKWRQDTTTINTSAANQANMEYAKQVNGLTNRALDQIWQRERDLMGFAFTGAESAMERSLRILLGEQDLEEIRIAIDAKEDANKTAFYSDLLFGTGNSIGDIFGKGGLLGAIV